MNSKEKETLASNTELAKEVLATQMQNTNVEELDYSLAALKEQDRVKAVQIMKDLDENNYSSLDNFGQDVYDKVNVNANNVLSNVRGKDISNLGLDLDTLLEKVNSISPKDINKADPSKALFKDIFGFARRHLYRLKNHYSSLDSQVDTIAESLELSVAELQNDNRTYEALKEQAKQTFEELNAYIAAGEAKVLELGHTIDETNKSIENDNTSNKMSLTTQTTSLVNYQTRLRKKTQDMRNLQFYLAFIQYPSISQLQSDNELVINNIRDTIQNGLPIYKTNLTTILGALRTRKAIEQTKAVREVINKQISLAKEDKQNNKAFTKRKKEVLSVLKELDDIDLNFSTKARLDIEKLDKILKDNEAIIELSFGNLLEEALTTLDLIENKAIEIKTTDKTMTDDYVIQKAIQNLK